MADAEKWILNSTFRSVSIEPQLKDTHGTDSVFVIIPPTMPDRLLSEVLTVIDKHSAQNSGAVIHGNGTTNSRWLVIPNASLKEAKSNLRQVSRQKSHSVEEQAELLARDASGGRSYAEWLDALRRQPKGDGQQRQ